MTLNFLLSKHRKKKITPNPRGKRKVGDASCKTAAEEAKYRKENETKLKKQREENKAKKKEYDALNLLKAAAQNAAKNAELTHRMHHANAGDEFRTYNKDQVDSRTKEIMENPRDLFDGRSLADALKSKEFAVYIWSTRTEVVESNMLSLPIPTAPGGYGEPGRFLTNRGSQRKVRVALPLPPDFSSHSLPPPSLSLSLSLTLQLTRASSKTMRRSVARNGNLYYRNRPIFKRVDPADPHNREADITVTFKFLREQLKARIEILHFARVRFQVDQIEGALQDELQHKLKYDYPHRLHRHKQGPKSDGDTEMTENYLAKCGVTALKIEKLQGKDFFWVNGHKLRIYR